jgi:hypothetical protein
MTTIALQQTNGVFYVAHDDFNVTYATWRPRQNNDAGQSLPNHYYKNNYTISTLSHTMHFQERNAAGMEILGIDIISNVL